MRRDTARILRAGLGGGCEGAVVAETVEPGKTGDAVGALGFKGTAGLLRVVREMAAVAVFDGNGGEFGHGSCGGVGSASVA